METRLFMIKINKGESLRKDKLKAVFDESQCLEVNKALSHPVVV